jgi:hypothetical protein
MRTAGYKLKKRVKSVFFIFQKRRPILLSLQHIVFTLNLVKLVTKVENVSFGLKLKKTHKHEFGLGQTYIIVVLAILVLVSVNISE